jgi:hypothetical protein
MAKKQKPTSAPADDALKNVSDYRFPEATRKNNPPAKIAAEGYVPLIPKLPYFYSPRRPPELCFDPTGAADELPELLAGVDWSCAGKRCCRRFAAALRWACIVICNTAIKVYSEQCGPLLQAPHAK